MITMICFQIVHQLEQVVISLIAKVLELSVMGKDQLFSMHFVMLEYKINIESAVEAPMRRQLWDHILVSA